MSFIGVIKGDTRSLDYTKSQPGLYNNVSIPMLAVSVKVCAGIVACTSCPDCR